MPQVTHIAFIILIVFALEGLVFCTTPNINVNFSKDISTRNLDSVFTSTDRFMTVKKWQVGRVSRKHYEIVNMLWRKTKIFVNMETTVPYDNRFKRNNQRTTLNSNNQNGNPMSYTTLRPFLFSSTESYIEFYYLDDNDERIKRRDSFIPKFDKSIRKQQHSGDNVLIQPPILSFRATEPTKMSLSKITLQTDKSKISSTVTTKNPSPRKQFVNKKPPIYGFLSSKFKIGLVPSSRLNNITNDATTVLHFNYPTCPRTTQEPELANVSNLLEISSSNKISTNTDSAKTTAYDKIKFFEMYDQQTAKPSHNFYKLTLNDEGYDNMIKKNEIDVVSKVNLVDVDQNDLHRHDGSKVKKHIIDKSGDSPTEAITTTTTSGNKTAKQVKFKTVVFNVNKIAPEHQNYSLKVYRNSSRVALWSNYPFAAVYVYEPSQIHCDAAALSPHWLVAAGSCLSRFHKKDPMTEGRSAFVAYCGEKWWQPERVSYVKYSIVHPRFHPKDNERRILYNIGLVQVVGSMSSCSGWAPISLMSHHFAAEPGGSVGTAIGWGLDRYYVRYLPVELPKLPLSAFDGFVYSESCPGSKAFGKRKSLGEESIMRNIYCLTLPPYTGESNDPVHGSLLLVGGKLIALYLQEERRILGEQSAQYTGVWRLVPWVHEVARELDEGFSLDF